MGGWDDFKEQFDGGLGLFKSNRKLQKLLEGRPPFREDDDNSDCWSISKSTSFMGNYSIDNPKSLKKVVHNVRHRKKNSRCKILLTAFLALLILGGGAFACVFFGMKEDTDTGTVTPNPNNNVAPNNPTKKLGGLFGRRLLHLPHDPPLIRLQREVEESWKRYSKSR